MMFARSYDEEIPIKFKPKLNCMYIWEGFKCKEDLEDNLLKAINA